MCYLPSGTASSVNQTSTGNWNQVSLNFHFPPTGYGWRTRTRVTATGADGELTLDITVDSPEGYTYPGDQDGTVTQSYPYDTDISGGLTIDQTMIDVWGNTEDAEGLIYPPDPVTNTC